MVSVTRTFAVLLAATLVGGCGGSPPAKVEEPAAPSTSRPSRSGSSPQVAQELGSIDQAKVEQTLSGLQHGALETCHTQGRERVELLAGDVKVFLRIDASGKVRYGYLEDSTLGDRDTEKCIIAVLSRATWPKPEGGEAEVRSGFGWGNGGEREPTAWSSDKVTGALGESRHVRQAVDACKSGVKGDLVVTAYVEQSEEAPEDAKPAPAARTTHPGKHGKKASKEPSGHFKALGVAARSKEAAEKIDCLVDALKPLELPSPGSYAAKVTFSL
ncbi:MAG: hypothetical protein JWP97_480 [Labilithrix sp.]|nr:hypothetical protein [Labilithrix sp.]